MEGDEDADHDLSKLTNRLDELRDLLDAAQDAGDEIRVSEILRDIQTVVRSIDVKNAEIK